MYIVQCKCTKWNVSVGHFPLQILHCTNNASPGNSLGKAKTQR